MNKNGSRHGRPMKSATRFVGRRYGTLVITAAWHFREGKDKTSRVKVAILCDCGRKSQTNIESLRRGHGCAICSQSHHGMTDNEALEILRKLR